MFLVEHWDRYVGKRSNPTFKKKKNQCSIPRNGQNIFHEGSDTGILYGFLMETL